MLNPVFIKPVLDDYPIPPGYGDVDDYYALQLWGGGQLTESCELGYYEVGSVLFNDKQFLMGCADSKKEDEELRKRNGLYSWARTHKGYGLVEFVLDEDFRVGTYLTKNASKGSSVVDGFVKAAWELYKSKIKDKDLDLANWEYGYVCHISLENYGDDAIYACLSFSIDGCRDMFFNIAFSKEALMHKVVKELSMPGFDDFSDSNFKLKQDFARRLYGVLSPSLDVDMVDIVMEGDVPYDKAFSKTKLIGVSSLTGTTRGRCVPSYCSEEEFKNKNAVAVIIAYSQD